jgi:hypothetical protein
MESKDQWLQTVLLAVDEQGEDFLEDIAEQQHKGEHHRRQQQRGQHLTGQIFVQRFQTMVETLKPKRKIRNDKIEVVCRVEARSEVVI